jgi:hypothetical protein
MPLSTLTCPSCGAPVPPSTAGAVTCAYCGSTLLGVDDAGWEARLDGLAREGEDDPLDARPWCRVLGQKFLVHAPLGAGETSDVFFGERARRPTELVVLKVWRDASATPPFAPQWRLLESLGRSEGRRSPLMTTLLPQLVVMGTMRSRSGVERPALVTRWRSGYRCTLRDVRRAYPAGVDAQTAVWIWRRLLELLGWIHHNGVVHASVRPEHVLLHPRDHGVVLVGWSHAAPVGSMACQTDDVVASAESLRSVLTGSPPAPLRSVLDAASRGARSDAVALSAEVCEAAREAFGPPRYHPFTMPDLPVEP